MALDHHLKKQMDIVVYRDSCQAMHGFVYK